LTCHQFTLQHAIHRSDNPKALPHHTIVDEKVWFLSLDVKTDGKRARIIQFLGELGGLYLDKQREIHLQKT
jgi:hypothetical protein